MPDGEKKVRKTRKKVVRKKVVRRVRKKTGGKGSGSGSGHGHKSGSGSGSGHTRKKRVVRKKVVRRRAKRKASSKSASGSGSGSGSGSKSGSQSKGKGKGGKVVKRKVRGKGKAKGKESVSSDGGGGSHDAADGRKSPKSGAGSGAGTGAGTGAADASGDSDAEILPAEPDEAEEAARAATQQAEAEAAAVARAEAAARAEAEAAAARAAERDDEQFIIVAVAQVDGEMKSKLRISQYTTGQELMDMYARKIDLLETQLFDIAMIEDGEDGLDVGEFTWVDRDVACMAQGIGPDTFLQVRVRFFSLSVAKSADATAVALQYAEVRARVLAEKWATTLAEAIKLASFSFVCEYGNYDPSKHKEGLLVAQLDTLVPPCHVPKKKKARRKLEDAIFAAAAEISGTIIVIAQMNYCEYAAGLADYGSTLYTVSGGNAVAFTPRGITLYADGTGKHVDRTLDYDGPLRPASYAASGTTVSVTGLDGESDLSFAVGSSASAANAVALLTAHGEMARTGNLPERSGVQLSREPQTMTLRIRAGWTGDKGRLITIDETATVDDLMNTFADLLRIHDRRWFGLCVSTADADRWLTPSRLVMDEHVHVGSILVYKLRVIVLDERELSKSKDARARHLYYLQFRQYILDGTYTVTEEQALRFAAYRFLADFGSYFPPETEIGEEDEFVFGDDEDDEELPPDPTTTKGYLVSQGIERCYIPHYLAVQYSDSEWEKKIRAVWRDLGDLGNAALVERIFVEEVLSLNSFGVDYFTVYAPVSGKTDTGAPATEPLLLGISQKGMALVRPPHFDVVTRYPWPITRLKNQPHTVSLEKAEKTSSGSRNWVTTVLNTISPMQGANIRVLASLYQQIAFRRAHAKK